MQSVEKLPGPVEAFHLVLEELRRKAEQAVLHNKPDRWDYYVEMVERLTEWFSGAGRERWQLRGRGARTVPESAAECRLLARREAVRLWALGVYPRRILRARGARTGARPRLEWLRRRAASMCVSVREGESTD